MQLRNIFYFECIATLLSLQPLNGFPSSQYCGFESVDYTEESDAARLRMIERLASFDRETAEDALKEIIDSHQHFIRRIIQTRFRGLDSDELESRVHHKLWQQRRIFSFDNYGAFLTWLRKVTKRLVIDQMRLVRTFRKHTVSLATTDRDSQATKPVSLYAKIRNPVAAGVRSDHLNVTNVLPLESHEVTRQLARDSLVDQSIARIVSVIGGSELQLKVLSLILKGNSLIQIQDILSISEGTSKSASRIMRQKIQQIAGLEDFFVNVVESQSQFIYEIELETIAAIEAADMQQIDSQINEFKKRTTMSQTSSLSLTAVNSMIKETQMTDDQRNALVKLSLMGMSVPQIATESAKPERDIVALLTMGIASINARVRETENENFTIKDFQFADFTLPRLRPTVTGRNKIRYLGQLSKFSERERMIWRMVFQRGFSSFQTSIILKDPLVEIENFIQSSSTR